jgi:transposase-like protein
VVSPDLLRMMISTFIQLLMSAIANAVHGAGHGERSPEPGRLPQRIRTS